MTDNENKYWWANDEEGPYKGPFETEDDCHSDAYCDRADCFDDPSRHTGVWILNGKPYDNPDYDPEEPRDGYDNCPFNITGTPKYVESLDITDKFHDAWAASITPSPAADRFDELVRVVEGAAKIFREYERLHLAKSPPDRAKAERNGEYAFQMEEALAAWKNGETK